LCFAKTIYKKKIQEAYALTNIQPLVEILHFGIEYFIPKGDSRGIQNF
jgi:hypothetical protein